MHVLEFGWLGGFLCVCGVWFCLLLFVFCCFFPHLFKTIMFIPVASHTQQKPVILYLVPNTAVILLYSFMPMTIKDIFQYKRVSDVLSISFTAFPGKSPTVMPSPQVNEQGKKHYFVTIPGY